MSESTHWSASYDWREAFSYAKGGSYAGNPHVQAVGECAITPFSEHDVAEVYAMAEGELDGPSWIMWGRLNDGRHFFLTAGCDYTGWDCQAGGDAYVSMDKDRLIDSAMDADARNRFKLPSRIGTGE